MDVSMDRLDVRRDEHMPPTCRQRRRLRHRWIVRAASPVYLPDEPMTATANTQTQCMLLSVAIQ